MEKILKSSHRLLTDYSKNGKIKTIAKGWVIFLGIYLVSRIPALQNALITFAKSVTVDWVTSLVNFIINGLWIFFIPMTIFSVVEYLKKQTFDQIRIYDSGLGFVDNKNGEENFAEYGQISISYNAAQGKFTIESKAIGLKSSSYFWNEFEQPDVMKNNFERYF